MAEQEPIRYIVWRNSAERVSDTTALPHRELTIDESGDIYVRRGWNGHEISRKPILQISAAELRLLAREARRAARRRFWVRLGIG